MIEQELGNLVVSLVPRDALRGPLSTAPMQPNICARTH
jgi:hypothetical protein